jgi:hypothetical protein
VPDSLLFGEDIRSSNSPRNLCKKDLYGNTI